MADVYLLGGYILKVILHHDLSQASLDQPFCALSLCWPVHTTQKVMQLSCERKFLCHQAGESNFTQTFRIRWETIRYIFLYLAISLLIETEIPDCTSGFLELNICVFYLEKKTLLHES